MFRRQNIIARQLVTNISDKVSDVDILMGVRFLTSCSIPIFLRFIQKCRMIFEASYKLGASSVTCRKLNFDPDVPKVCIIVVFAQ